MPRRPHGSTQTLKVLAALLAGGAEWRHGYDLLQETGLKSGTIYPLLIRLADDGLVEAEWRSPVAPARAPRHVYRLTAKGRALAHARLAESSTAATSALPRRAR
jgi:DNA-binding PadR family transcriptional regulator